MRKPNIAILGATGVVGRHILKILEELEVPMNSLKLLASSKSAGKELEFKGQMIMVEETSNESFNDVDIVLASAGGSTSLKYAKEAVKRGCVFIDNSSAFRLDPEIPLVIVGVNDEDLRKHKGIIANPNCSTSQLMLVLNPLKQFGIKRLMVSTYQAVSGAGLKAINELTANTRAALMDMEFKNECFKKPIAFNVIPQIDVFCENGYTKEEMKVNLETKKILHLPDSTPISCTAVRVPVYNSHSEAVEIEFEESVSPKTVRQILSESYGLEVIDDPDNYMFPTTRDAAGKDPVYVGRIRKSIGLPNGIALWCVGDNLRIGAALNTVRIAKKVISMELY